MPDWSHFLLADWLSLLVVLYATTPFAFYILTEDTRHLMWGIAVFIAPILAEMIKKGTVALGLQTHTWCRRPTGAFNCNTWNSNGPQGGAPGFPSGHTATTAAFWIGAWILFNANETLVGIVGIVGIIAMGFARLNKRCHTFLQILGGAILGAGTTYTLLRHR